MPGAGHPSPAGRPEVAFVKVTGFTVLGRPSVGTGPWLEAVVVRASELRGPCQQAGGLGLCHLARVPDDAQSRPGLAGWLALHCTAWCL